MLCSHTDEKRSQFITLLKPVWSASFKDRTYLKSITEPELLTSRTEFRVNNEGVYKKGKEATLPPKERNNINFVTQ